LSGDNGVPAPGEKEAQPSRQLGSQ
jgi:hypothetical protein